MNYQWLTYQALLKAQQSEENPWTRLLKGQQQSSTKRQLSQVLHFTEHVNEERNISHNHRPYPQPCHAGTFQEDVDQYDEAVSRITGGLDPVQGQVLGAQRYGRDAISPSDSGHDPLLQKKRKNPFSRAVSKMSKGIQRWVSHTRHDKRGKTPSTTKQPEKQRHKQKTKQQQQQQFKRPQSVNLYVRDHSPVAYQRSASTLPQIYEDRIDNNLVNMRYGVQSSGNQNLFYEAQQMLTDLEANAQLAEEERADLIVRLTTLSVDQSRMDTQTLADWERMEQLGLERQQVHERLQELEDVQRQMDVCIGELKGMISQKESMMQSFSNDEVRELQRVVVSSLLFEMEAKLNLFKETSHQLANGQKSQHQQQQNQGGIKRELSVRLAPLRSPTPSQSVYEYGNHNSVQNTPRQHQYARPQSAMSTPCLPEYEDAVRRQASEFSQNIQANQQFLKLTMAKSSPEFGDPPNQRIQTSVPAFPHKFNDQQSDANQVQRELSDGLVFVTQNRGNTQNLKQVPQLPQIQPMSTFDPFDPDWDSDNESDAMYTPRTEPQKEQFNQSKTSQSQQTQIAGPFDISRDPSLGNSSSAKQRFSPRNSDGGLSLEVSISKAIADGQLRREGSNHTPDFGAQLGHQWQPLGSYPTPKVFTKRSFEEYKGKLVQIGHVNREDAKDVEYTPRGQQRRGFQRGDQQGGLKESPAESFKDLSNMEAILEDQSVGDDTPRTGETSARSEGRKARNLGKGAARATLQNAQEDASVSVSGSSDTAISNKPLAQKEKFDKGTPRQTSPRKPPQAPPTPPESKRSSTPPPPPLPLKRGTSPVPPPPPGRSKGALNQPGVQKNREVINFFQELRRSQIQRNPPSRNASNAPSKSGGPVDKNALMAEIVGKSSYIESVNRDIETKADMIQELIVQVNKKSAKNIQDLIEFVSEVDGKLSGLSDETAVLKAFEWPTSKYDTFREACAQYQSFIKMKSQMMDWKPNTRAGSNITEELAKVQSFQEQIQIKMDKYSRQKESDEKRYKDHNVPWPQDIYNEVVHASLNLAAIYMQLVINEVQRVESSNRTLSQDQELQIRQKSLQLLTNAVRFGFRVHQFAGGFDKRCNELFEQICARTRSNMQNNHSNGR
eukprot:TRINITY_DN1573_c7_g1_i1.p1 TRINITY_DN1573_c7_g1~~TRINITY_DN1573_c7_g1_i1.p1  ORF type:complete len:1120 (-),score=172.57 TRINITY_DN1573_c7_g1_i1:1407-4766(-)